MPTKQTHIISLIITGLLMSGCIMRTDFEAPNIELPQAWQHSDSSNEPVTINRWWTRFNDPKLNQVIIDVLATNNDLAMATLTLHQARLQANLSRDDFYPDTNINAAGDKSKLLDSGQTSTNYSANIGVSYELDLWGRVQAAADQTKWTAMATQQDREATAQSLVATTATLYWQIGYLNDRLSLGQLNIKAAEDSLTMTQNQYINGAISPVNVLQAKRILLSRETTQSQYRQQLVESQNAFAILFNQLPQQDNHLNNSLPDNTLPKVAVGIPSDLLVRRPDVKSKLFELKSALASKDQVNASYMPTLTLTGALGGSSDALKDLLSDPIGTLGADLVLPFIQWNEMSLNNEIAKIQYQSAIIDYRQTLFNAFNDVNNALSARQQLSIQADKLLEQYQSSVALLKIYDNQYINGALEFKDLLDAQSDERDDKASLLENRFNQYVALATLYQALGGDDVMKL
ncbi:MAG: efflux transporter outer membrane subunit [Shewanella sp.]